MTLYLQNVGSLHVPSMRAGLRGLGALSLGVNKANVRVGEDFTYSVRGGPPNAKIYWSSKKDGIPTAEVNTYYGHLTDASGNFDATITWPEMFIGEWIKYIVIYDAAGNAYSAAVAFNVLPAQTAATTTTTTTNSGSSTTTATASSTDISSSSIPVSSGSYSASNALAPVTTPAPVSSLSPGFSFSDLSTPGFFSRSFSIGSYEVTYLTAAIALGLTGFYLYKKRR